MSQQFLREGDAVVICGRDSERIDAAVNALQTEAPRSQVEVWCENKLSLLHIPR